MSRVHSAAQLILQSPPGEVNDVFNDVRVIVAEDDTLEAEVEPVLQAYNEEQLVTVQLDGKNVLVSEPAKLPLRSGEDAKQQRYLDPRSSTHFVVNHITTVAEDAQTQLTDSETESLRSGLDKVLEPYVKNHYADGVCAVYALPDANYPPEPEPEPVVEQPVEPVEAPAEAQETEETDGAKIETVADELSQSEDQEGQEQEMVVDTPAPPPVSEGDEPQPEEATPGETPSSIETPSAEEIKPAEDDAVPPPEEPVVPEEKVVEPVKPKPYPAVRSRIFAIYIVGNKYNASNYWTGRWRTTYTVDLVKKTLEGTAKINIHYYEGGNVQLATTFSSAFPLPSSDPSPAEVIALVKKAETDAQAKLSESCTSLSDETFRSLRRALPKTKSKMEWGRISAYRLGSELGNSTPKET